MPETVSYFDERRVYLETAKPIWDRICDQIDQFMAAKLENEDCDDDNAYLCPEYVGSVYDWETYISKFDGRLDQLNSRENGANSHFEAPRLISPWGHQISSGWEIDLWFTGQGGRRPPDDETQFLDEPKATVVCCREGIYDGQTGRLLDIDDLNKFSIDVDRLCGI